MNYLKSIITVFIFTLTCHLSNAQEETVLENSVLWKIEHPDLKEASYIFGTLHFMCESDFNIPEKVTETLNHVDALVLEVNLTDPEEMQILQETMSNPKKISDELSEIQFKEVATLVQKEMGIPLIDLDTYGLSTLHALLLTKMLPCTQFKFTETEITTLAKEKQLPIYSLEKVSEQLATLENSYPADFMFDQLMLFESYKTDFNASIAAYKKEDLPTAVDLIMKDIYMDENATTMMQVNRNKNWVEKIPEMIKIRSNLFAVGAAHLVGEFGIVNLLRQKGYTITPVFN